MVFYTIISNSVSDLWYFARRYIGCLKRKRKKTCLKGNGLRASLTLFGRGYPLIVPICCVE